MELKKCYLPSHPITFLFLHWRLGRPRKHGAPERSQILCILTQQFPIFLAANLSWNPIFFKSLAILKKLFCMHGTYSLCYKLKMRQFKFLFENKNRDYVGINYYFFFLWKLPSSRNKWEKWHWFNDCLIGDSWVLVFVFNAYAVEICCFGWSKWGNLVLTRTFSSWQNH